MKMIPPSLFDSKSSAEEKIFKYLREITLSEYDFALHSLNIARHERKRWSEADFIIVSRRGILLLEVKGGRVACKDGVWEFTNRHDETNRKKEGPFAQAASAYSSLERNYLYDKFKGDLRGVPRGWAVVFPDIPKLVINGSSDFPEMPPQISAYEMDCAGHNKFKAFLERAFDHWGAGQVAPRELGADAVHFITKSMRPDFEQVPSLKRQLGVTKEQVHKFTEEQYEKLDAIAENPRIMVSGGAGTGKTFLAVACARYEAAEGRTVLFVTRSEYLATFLSTQDLPGEVTVACIDELPKLAGEGRTWQVAIVDEGQDLCSGESLDLISGALEGGLDEGRWRWFGDPNHQVSPSFPVEQFWIDYLRSQSFATRLKNNIRNTGKVVEAIRLVSGADVGKPSSNPDAGLCEMIGVDTEADVIPRAVAAVRTWLGGDDKPGRHHIAVLVPATDGIGSMVDALEGSGIRAEALSKRALGGKTRGCVLVSGIEDFKGLERSLVCVAGLGEGDQLASKAYKAVSRASHGLSLVATKASLQAVFEEGQLNAASAKGN
jgi:hypothetical protein